MPSAQIAERYERRAAAFDATVRGVPSSAWSNQTPCAEWTARQLVKHVADNAGVFLGFVGKPAPTLPPIEEDPVATWRASNEAVRTALGDPAVADQQFEGYFGPTTFERAVDAFLSFDLVVHRWDLARATGQDERIPPEEIEQVFEAARGFGPALHSPGVCADPVEVAADADDQTRLLAFLGRRA